MIKIEIWSDINCPFCYIGKRHLEEALERFPKRHEVEIEWKSFELDPADHPPKGIDQTDLLAQKYGRDRQWAQEMNNNMTEMAALAGLDFKMDQVIPANSFQAHRLIHLAKARGKQDEMEERLFAAKFTEGKDISDLAVLKELGIELALNPNDLNDLFAGDQYAREVREDEHMASRLGITGVPFFVFNSREGISGAHPVETFIQVLNKLDHATSASAD